MFNPMEEITVPPSMKPYEKRNIDFNLFVELLMDKLDDQRVSLTLKELQRIHFEPYGVPKIIIYLFCFIYRKKFAKMS